jgi:ribosomal protein L12E/L44/L45/RPP1/RPP2
MGNRGILFMREMGDEAVLGTSVSATESAAAAAAAEEEEEEEMQEKEEEEEEIAMPEDARPDSNGQHI